MMILQSGRFGGGGGGGSASYVDTAGGTFRASGGPSGSGPGNLVIPATVQTGDMMILYTSVGNETNPGGGFTWNRIIRVDPQYGYECDVYWRLVDSTEVGGSTSIPVLGALVDNAGGCYMNFYRGATTLTKVGTTVSALTTLTQTGITKSGSSKMLQTLFTGRHYQFAIGAPTSGFPSAANRVSYAINPYRTVVYDLQSSGYTNSTNVVTTVSSSLYTFADFLELT